jgi:hypothetical protein
MRARMVWKSSAARVYDIVSSPSDPLRVPISAPVVWIVLRFGSNNKRLALRAQPFVRSDAFLTFLKCLSAKSDEGAHVSASSARPEHLG